MRWKRPHHSRWLAACLLAVLLSTLAGGFSLGVVAVFLVIFLTGAALLNLDDADGAHDDPEPDESGDGEPANET